MKVLVTGARGLVGGPLCRRLSADHRVEALDLPEFDVRDAARCRDAFAAFAPERVVHLAAWTDVDGAERDPAGAAAVNVDGTKNVAAACRDVGAPMLYVSTDYVFDGAKNTPYREDDATHPLSAYGRTKLAGEAHVRELAPRWWIVRCQSVYGAGRKSFVDAILSRAASGGALSVVADQRVSPSWCEDVAEALVAVLLEAPHGLYLASNSGSCTWRECAQAVVELAGLSVDVGSKTAAQHAAERATAGQLTALRPAYSVFDCSKLVSATGRQVRPWREALRAYLISRTPQAAAK
jgi:dTDP-4-dehydrorhamnose reductase